ncbi:MAG: PD-(D/E)XK nuclease family protein [Desulfovibrionales bacterium]|nr:MAG: PD-(D/E)XK nuclease family protein [Desulfovibrionales bacterium]
MQIILGYMLDGGSYPDALGEADAVSGKVVVGPMGMLSILETRLGLKEPSTHPAVRIGQYLARLKTADDGHRFYSKSFEADAWATANELLGWRDALVFGGWDGKAIQGMSARLVDLVDVESLEQPALSPGIGERLQRVVSALEGATAGHLGISSLDLVEPEQEWPLPWRNVFQTLSLAGVSRRALKQDMAESPGDLGLLQNAFQTKNCPRKTPSGDGSLLLIAGQTEAEAAEALAEWLAADSEANKDVLIIKGMGSRLLDEALHARGLPRLGSDSGSRWRAALQVLLLALKNAWLPVNPQLLLEILTSPSSPIPRWAGRHFVDALQKHPGVGGELWVKAREAAVLEKQQCLEQEGLPTAKASRKMREFQEVLDFWLGGKRYDPQTGMPAREARKICAEVARLAAARGGHTGDALLVAAMSQAKDLEEAIKVSSLETITRPQLKRMVDEVLRFGGSTPGLEPEAAQWHSVKSPGQVWSGAQTIVWWSFLEQTPSHAAHVWTRSERKALADAGVHLEEMQTQRLIQAGFWRRPVLLAGQRLLLVMHRTEAADKTALHPLWDEIKQAVAPKDADERLITVEAGQLRTREQVTFGPQPDARVMKRSRLLPQTLPQARPSWDIPANMVGFRPRESASSLEKLLGCPLAWVLHYHAKIKMGALLSLPKDAQLTGILAHAVVERLFKPTGRCDPQTAREQAAAVYEQLLPEMAAGLLQEGQAVERQQNRERICESVTALALMLEQCSLTVEDAELYLTKPVQELNTEFQGSLDLVLKDKNGNRAILDLKWSKYSKYKREELQAGLALQLAAYAWLLGKGKPLPAGYYMLAQAELLTTDISCFPGQNVVQGPPLSEVWASLLDQSREVMSALSNGQAHAPGAEPEADPTLNSCRFCDYTSLCGARREVDA